MQRTLVGEGVGQLFIQHPELQQTWEATADPHITVQLPVAYSSSNKRTSSALPSAYLQATVRKVSNKGGSTKGNVPGAATGGNIQFQDMKLQASASLWAAAEALGSSCKPEVMQTQMHEILWNWIADVFTPGYAVKCIVGGNTYTIVKK
jgi:hypothetical protein